VVADDAVPYFAQWESRELVGPIIQGEIAARDDPRWASSGADNRDEYEFWSWRVCGMACLKTLLLAWRDSAHGTVTLGKEVLDAGGYRMRSNGLDGLIYVPFCTYLDKRWSIAAAVYTRTPVSEIIQMLRAGDWFMASVSPAIRRPEATPPSRGGHLVLVHDTSEGDLIFHNPSGDTPDSQQSVRIPPADFAKFYAGRGIRLHRS
jgi:hypothetical protein